MWRKFGCGFFVYENGNCRIGNYTQSKNENVANDLAGSNSVTMHIHQGKRFI